RRGRGARGSDVRGRRGRRVARARALGIGAAERERMIDRVAVERWVAWVRLGGAAFALFEVALFSPGVPPGYRPAQWSLTAALAAGAAVLFVLARNAPRGWLPTIGL